MEQLCAPALLQGTRICGEQRQPKLPHWLARYGADLLNVLVCTNQLQCELLDIPLELLYQLCLRVIILYRAVSDQSCLGCVGERHIIFFKELVAWVQTCDHETRGVAAETLPQQAC